MRNYVVLGYKKGTDMWVLDVKPETKVSELIGVEFLPYRKRGV